MTSQRRAVVHRTRSTGLQLLVFAHQSDSNTARLQNLTFVVVHQCFMTHVFNKHRKGFETIVYNLLFKKIFSTLIVKLKDYAIC